MLGGYNNKDTSVVIGCQIPIIVSPELFVTQPAEYDKTYVRLWRGGRTRWQNEVLRRDEVRGRTLVVVASATYKCLRAAGRLFVGICFG